MYAVRTLGRIIAIRGSGLATAMVLSVGLIGCANQRALPVVFMPDPPKECEQVLDFKVEPLTPGKSNAAKLSVDMAKEGAARQQEHAKSKVCAEYALRTAGVMKDKDRAPTPGEPMVDSAKRIPKARSERPARQKEAPEEVASIDR